MNPLDPEITRSILDGGDIGHQFALLTIVILVAIVAMQQRTINKQSDAVSSMRAAIAVLTAKLTS